MTGGNPRWRKPEKRAPIGAKAIPIRGDKIRNGRNLHMSELPSGIQYQGQAAVHRREPSVARSNGKKASVRFPSANPTSPGLRNTSPGRLNITPGAISRASSFSCWMRTRSNTMRVTFGHETAISQQRRSIEEQRAVPSLLSELDFRGLSTGGSLRSPPATCPGPFGAQRTCARQPPDGRGVPPERRGGLRRPSSPG